MPLLRHASSLVRKALPYAEASSIIAFVTGAGLVIVDRLELPNISLIFVIPVLTAAVRHGLYASLWAALLSVVSYDYFFLPPLHQLSIANPADLLALIFLLLVAVVASALAARAHDQAEAAQDKARATAQLYEFSRNIAALTDLDELLAIAVAHLEKVLDAKIVVLLPNAGNFEACTAFPSGAELDLSEFAAARRAWHFDSRTGGINDPTTPSARYFVPLSAARSEIGVVGVLPLDSSQCLTSERRELLDACCSQLAVAIERQTLAREAEAARIGAERERLRSALLTSVSHDLRTPLASIIGGLSSLRSYRDLYDDSARDELLETALNEAERLNRFVGNLLDMTRLDAGAIVAKRELVEVGDLVSTTLRRAAPILKDRTIVSTIAPDLPVVSLDFVLAEQALFNILDNAVKYSAIGGRIEVEGRLRDGRIEIVVRDDGPGIDPAALHRLFDKFYRANEGDQRGSGTGLGLAIAKGFVEVQGGTVAAFNRPDRRGAEFVVSFPT